MKTTTRIYFRIADADHPMYHGEYFETLGQARIALNAEYVNRNKGDGYDGYWRSRNHNIEMVTTTVTVMETVPGIKP